MPIFELSNNSSFPPPHFSERDGLLAVGGDLSEKRLLKAVDKLKAETGLEQVYGRLADVTVEEGATLVGPLVLGAGSVVGAQASFSRSVAWQGCSVGAGGSSRLSPGPAKNA